MNKVKNILLIFMFILTIYFFYQNQNLKYCNNAWADMYWSEEMQNMVLQDELNFYKQN